MSSFHLADLGGEAVEADAIWAIQFPLIVEGHVKPFHRSHPPSLAQSKMGERGWRGGKASIPLVNLSEPILYGIGRDPWFAVAAASEHGPGEARELVGERNSQEIATREAPGSPLDPWAQGTRGCGGPPLEDDLGCLHKEGAQVLVAALGDSAELGAIADRLLLRDEAQPRGSCVPA